MTSEMQQPTAIELANINLLDSVLLALDQLHGLAYIMENMSESPTIDKEESDIFVVLSRTVRACDGDLQKAADEVRAARVDAR